MGLSNRLAAAVAAFRSAGGEVPARSAEIPPSGATEDTASLAMGHGDAFAGAPADAWRREYAVRTVVDFVAQKIASLPFHAYRMAPDGDHVRDTTGELARLIADPSIVPCETRYRLFHALIVDTMLSDRFCCIVSLDDDYDWRLRRVPPSHFSVDYDSLGEPTRVSVSLPTLTQTFDLPDPRVVLSLGFGGDCGSPFPVTRTLRPLLDEARELASYRRQVARNGGRPSAWVSRDKDAPRWSSEEARSEFVQGMRAYRKGGGQEGGWPLLEDGMQIHTFDGFKPVDVADLDARDKINVQVCNAYHISPENVGFRTGNKSSVQAYKEQLWNVELRPYIVAFEQALNKSLPRALGEVGSWVEANLDAQLRGTTSEQYQALSTATGRPFMATDEARRILSLPTLGDGYDRPITPLNVTEGGQPSPQDGGRTQNAQEGASPNGEE